MFENFITGREILELRHLLGWSQGKLAAEVGVANGSVVSRWETGRNAPVGVQKRRLMRLKQKHLLKSQTQILMPVDKKPIRGQSSPKQKPKKVEKPDFAVAGKFLADWGDMSEPTQSFVMETLERWHNV